MSRHRKQSYSHGRWAIRRERFHLTAAWPTPEERVITPADCIRSIIDKKTVEQSRWTQTLMAEWVDLLGDQIARQARPGESRDGVLTVYVRSPVWLSELKRFGRKSMLQKLQARFGPEKVSDIRLAPDPDG